MAVAVMSDKGEHGGNEQGASAASNRSAESQGTRRVDFLLLALFIVLGAWLRLDFMRAASFAIDADEAIVGLMARHIVEGREIPIFYYGQHYMGSLEALMVAGLFGIFGPSSIALQTAPLICALLLIPVMYAVGRILGGRVAGLVAALLTSIPPVGLVVWSVKARGGFIEILLLGAVSLLIALKWWRGGSYRLVYPSLLGLVLGVGFWTNNQILYFIGPLGIFTALYVIQGLLKRALSIGRFASVVVAGTVSFFIGSAPFWIYNLQNEFSSFGMYGSASAEQVLKHTQGLFSTALPVLLGAVHFWEVESAFPFSIAAAYTLYGAVFFAFFLARSSEWGELLRGRVDWARPIEIAPLIILFSCAIFVVSTYGWLVQAPRYLLPLYVPLFLVCGFVVAKLSPRRPQIAWALVSLLVLLNLASAYAGGRAVPGEPVVFKGQRVSRDHSELIHALSDLGITKVRTNYWIGYRLAFETGERVTFSIFGAPYQVRLPQYEEGREPSSYNRIPIVAVPAEAAVVRDVLQTLGYTFKEFPVSGYVLFHAITEGEASRPMPNPWAGVRLSAVGSRDPKAALDGDPSTRWGTGVHQSPGQSFRIDFAKPRKVAGLSYDLAGFLHDYPRGLRIELEKANGTRRTVLSELGYTKVSFYLKENRGISLYWPSEPIKAIILTQTKGDPVFDWSIAELYLYEPVR